MDHGKVHCPSFVGAANPGLVRAPIAHLALGTPNGAGLMTAQLYVMRKTEGRGNRRRRWHLRSDVNEIAAGGYVNARLELRMRDGVEKRGGEGDLYADVSPAVAAYK